MRPLNAQIIQMQKKRQDRIDNIPKSKENLFHSKMHGNRLKKKKGNWKAYVKPFITE